MKITLETPRTGDIVALLTEHLEDMAQHSPPESVHALDLEALCVPDIRFWVARDDNNALMGCGALRDLGEGAGEIKSMRTAKEFRRKGVAQGLLDEIVQAATNSGFSTLYLETGTPDVFAPARALYSANGFHPCAAFAEYPAGDPYSICMKRAL